MSTEKDFAYYEQHPDELTDEIASTLMLGGTIQGDTESSTEDEEGGKAPDAAEESDKGEPEKGAKEGQQQSEKQDDKPVVLAKDGKHTIPYEELEKARDEAKRWEEESRNKDALIEQLKSARATDEAQGSTEATDELIASVKEEYPLLAEFMEKLVDGRIKGLQQQVSESLKPIQKSHEDSARDAHFNAITQAHKDFDTLIDSGKVHAWAESLPAYARGAAMGVLERGTAQDVIDLISDYKSATGTQAPADTQPSKEDIAKKAEEAVSKAKSKSAVPASLSSIPSGGLPASDELGNLDGMSDQALLSSFMSLDPDKINERLNRML